MYTCFQESSLRPKQKNLKSKNQEMVSCTPNVLNSALVFLEISAWDHLKKEGLRKRHFSRNNSTQAPPPSLFRFFQTARLGELTLLFILWSFTPRITCYSCDYLQIPTTLTCGALPRKAGPNAQKCLSLPTGTDNRESAFRWEEESYVAVRVKITYLHTWSLRQPKLPGCVANGNYSGTGWYKPTK